MLKRNLVVLSVVIISVVLLAACGRGRPPAPEAEAPTQPAVEEPTVTPEPVAEVVEIETEEAAESTIRTFVIVPRASTASYSVNEEFFGGALDRLGIEPGLVDTIGSTQEVKGRMQLNLSDLANPVVGSRFTVDISTLSSNQDRRDKRIRSNNLESSRFPLAEFTITSLESVPGEYSDGQEVTFKANGDITIREITQPVTFDVTATLAGDTITGMATTPLKMTDFGFDPPNFAGVFRVEDDFTVNVDFTLVEQ